MEVKLLNAKDLQNMHGWGKDKAYELIRKIKEKFKLTYSEMVVREDIYQKYFAE